ncbi:hypothetical protein BS78_10G113500 [Paspalum vaginatum]|nr:hypothetical protein BS78_10G113500 [Paspalum vaginatum]
MALHHVVKAPHHLCPWPSRAVGRGLAPPGLLCLQPGHLYTTILFSRLLPDSLNCATPARHRHLTTTLGWRSPMTASGSRFEHKIWWLRRVHPPATSTSSFPCCCSFLQTFEGAPMCSKYLKERITTVSQREVEEGNMHAVLVSWLTV